jgi:hypothetical protein
MADLHKAGETSSPRASRATHESFARAIFQQPGKRLVKKQQQKKAKAPS